MEVYDLVVREGLRRGLSHRTILTYNTCLKQFFKKVLTDPRAVRKSDIQQYLDSLIQKGYSGNSLNVYHNSLKFFFEEILCRNLLLCMKYSKIPQELPTVLTKGETKRLFQSIENKKHSLMIRLMYSAGLRVSELVHLRASDIAFEQNIGYVRRGKGGKDRIFLLAEELKVELHEHVSSGHLSGSEFLFRGRGGHLTTRTLHEIVKQAAKKAGIQKNVHCHTLRHSFATHLIQDGYSVGDVQMLLGHNSPDTTMRYVHMASPKMLTIKSPYETLEKSH